jgi:hypothetical protein
MQDHVASKASVGFADDDQASAGSMLPRDSVLAHHLLAMGTSDRAMALIDPDLNTFRVANLGGQKPMPKISSHRFVFQLPGGDDRIGLPPAL